MHVFKSLVMTAAVLGVTLSAARAAEPLDIKVGWVTMYASSVPLSLDKKELLHHYGQSYTISPIRMASTAAMITGLATSDVNIGTLAYSSLSSAILNAKLSDIRVVMDTNQDGVGNGWTGHFMVLKDGPIKKVEDLKGHVIASLTYGSAVDVAIRAMLRKHGLDDKKDVTFVEASFPNMNSMLLQKKADLISSTEPWYDDPELQKNATTLFTQQQATGVTQLLVWASRAGYIKDHRAALVDFLEDSLRFEQWALDPKNHAEFIAMVAKAMKVAPESLGYVYTDHDLYKDPHGMPNMAALQSNIDLLHSLGFFPSGFTVADYTDLSLIKEADARLSK
ncbi:MAG TPA: ABC transporter substrate-binding protein [Stellaceae bacterium]|jgi:NitT/TauT family transport system substrate-binding protein|nr:ABC transporter substrate-binding protein [Stellaceae bacterium]